MTPIRWSLLTLGTLAMAGPPAEVRAQVPAEAPKAGASAEGPPTGPAITVEVDASDSPEAAAWAETAKRVVETWHPRAASMLKSDGFKPTSRLKLVFKSKMDGVAFASGTTITISGRWVRDHPDDLGMVVHELTHVIQGYPESEADQGWLVEGIADYIRFFKYEPGAAIGPFDPEGASYRDGYRTAARFLAWIEKTHDKSIIATMNRACRKGEYEPELFRKATSRTLDELWAEFVKASTPKS